MMPEAMSKALTMPRARPWALPAMAAATMPPMMATHSRTKATIRSGTAFKVPPWAAPKMTPKPFPRSAPKSPLENIGRKRRKIATAVKIVIAIPMIILLFCLIKSLTSRVTIRPLKWASNERISLLGHYFEHLLAKLVNSLLVKT